MKKVNLLATGFFLMLSFTLNAQNYQINSPNDDAEESAGYTVVNLNSPVINLTSDPTDAKFMKQIVGLRFTNVQLQKGTTLAGCYLAFTVDQPANKVSMLAITGEKSGNAQPFQAVNRNISSRPKTIARINWNAVLPWTQAGATMQSPDISKILTEIISLPDWAPGNSIVLMVEGNGLRHATAYDKNPQAAVQLILNNGAIVASTPSANAFPTSVNKSKPEPPAPVSQPEQTRQTPVPASQPSTPQASSSSSNLKSGSSLQESVNTTQAAATLGLANQIQVTIPQGVAPAGTKLTINSVSKEFKYDEIKILNAMDVTLSCGEKFQKPLEIKMYFDKSKLAEADNSESITPAYFDESTKQWVPYPDYTINEQEGSVSFKTSHLTTLSLFEFITTGFYSMKFENKDCRVFYSISDQDRPLNDNDYNKFKEEYWYIKKDNEKRKKDYYVPHMVQDIAHWVSEAKEKFSAEPNNLTVPWVKFSIYVRSLNESGYFHPVSGCLHFASYPGLSAPHDTIPANNVLKNSVAHELTHYIQDYYYVMNKGKIGFWWLEALAVNGELMAYGDRKTYLHEMEQFVLNRTKDDPLFVKLLMVNSWDSYNADPEFYGTGFFLHYLANYRKDKKINLATLLKKGGDNTDLSNFRTILDNYLKSDFNSSIGQEYAEFIKWAYTNKVSQIKIPSQQGDGLDRIVKVPDSFVSEDVTQNLPYLSAKIIKLRAPGINKGDVKVETTVISIDPGIKLFLCDVKPKTLEPVIIRELKVPTPDPSGLAVTTITTLSKEYNYNNILAINANKDKAGSVTINVKNLVQPKP